jgi:hypothetical protein
MMGLLPSECRESKVKYPFPWGGKGGNASWVQFLPRGIDTFHSFISLATDLHAMLVFLLLGSLISIMHIILFIALYGSLVSFLVFKGQTKTNKMEFQ